MNTTCPQSDDRAPRATSGHALALVALIGLGACDTQQQKPKTAAEAAAAFEFVSTAVAQQTDLVVPPTAISGVMQPVDEAFALFAASSGSAEVEAARLVLKTTRSADVRGYAEHIAREHTKSAAELRRIVAPRGLVLPPTPTGRHLDMVTKLSGVRPQDMDEAFLQRFGIDAHKEAIALFERHVTDGRDAALKRYAEQTLITLREHLGAAQKLLHAASRR